MISMTNNQLSLTINCAGDAPYLIKDKTLQAVVTGSSNYMNNFEIFLTSHNIIINYSKIDIFLIVNLVISQVVLLLIIVIIKLIIWYDLLE